MNKTTIIGLMNNDEMKRIKKEEANIKHKIRDQEMSIDIADLILHDLNIIDFDNIDNMSKILRGSNNEILSRKYHNVKKIKCVFDCNKEITLDNYKFTPIHKSNNDYCEIAMCDGINTEKVYLGITNDWQNECYLGYTKISCNIKQELHNNKYVNYIYINIYSS